MSIVLLLVVVAMVSLLITRVATIALTVTGMPRPSARFQARSALTGVGFTTTESETVVSHPARRRIIMALMLVGNLGLATAMGGVLAGFLSAESSGQALGRVALLVGGLLLVYLLAMSRWFDRRLSRVIGRLLRRFTDLAVRDYEAMLHVAGEYEVKEMMARDGGWLAGRTLADLRLRDEGVVVLGIARPDGSYLGVPHGDSEIQPDDTLILYGRASTFEDLTRRDQGAAGDLAHRRAAERQEEQETEERRGSATADLGVGAGL